MRHLAKFRGVPRHGSRPWNLKKNHNFNGRQGKGATCVIVPNFVVIGQTVAEIWRVFIFQNGRCPPSWIIKNSKFYR